MTAPQASSPREPEKLLESFNEALDEDINTAQAMGFAFELVRLLNKYVSAGDKPAAHKARAVLRTMGASLGLWPREPSEYFESLKAYAPESLTDEEIKSRVEARNEARSRKDWAEADRLRQELSDLGVILEDKAGQTVWRYA